MKILKDFDSGSLPPYETTGKGIRFDLRPLQRILNVLIQDAPAAFEVDILVDEKGEGFLLRQGLVAGEDGAVFRPIPLKKAENGVLRATVRTSKGRVRLASRYPYGRDGLEKLICETTNSDHITWRFLSGDCRGIPLAEFGQDDGRCPVHYFIAGEDAWETAGCWVADEMVRELCREGKLAEGFSEKCLIRIVPLVSPYSATTEKPSYCTLMGDGVYGAATWGDPEPPPEYTVLRKLVEETIKESRLGFMMTIHSWQAQSEHTGLETIKEAGENILSESRKVWAASVMAQIIDRVPRGRTSLPDKIWHPGLARDYLLAKHNAITFRVEITTAGLGPDDFRETGCRFLSNLLSISDWTRVLGDT